jgi:hypothetical protein
VVGYPFTEPMMVMRHYERVGQSLVAIAQVRRLVLATLTVMIVSALTISTDAQSAAVGSPTGKYSALILPLDAPSYTAPLDIERSHNFVFRQGPRGTWTETNGEITMTGRYETVTFVFVINQMGTVLGKRTEKGSVIEGGHPFGKWLAKRV